MVKDFLLTRSAPSVTPEALQRYLEHKHAPLALSLPVLVRETRRYTMNHVQSGVDERLCLYVPIANLATVVEHVFTAGIAGLHDDEEYIARVRPDEMHMIEALMDGPPQFLPIEEELPIFTAERLSSTRMLDFVRMPSGMSKAEFVERLAADAEWASAHPGYRAAVGRRVHSIVGSGSGAADFGGRNEPFDAVIESWIVDRDSLAAVMDEQRDGRALFCDPDRSFTAWTVERWLLGEADAFGPRETGGGHETAPRSGNS